MTAERALLEAVAAGQTSRLRRLLENGADVECAGEHGFPPLALAAERGDLEIMRELVLAGADLDSRSGGSDGWPPLMRALGKGRRESARALLEWGADPNVRAESGFSALMMAAADGDEELVEGLLAAGADPRARQFLGFTALDYAVGYGHSHLVRRLLVAAPDLLHDPRPSRRAVLLLARAMGCTEVLALLDPDFSTGTVAAAAGSR